MLHKVKKRFYYKFTNYEPGDKVEMTENDTKRYKGYIEKAELSEKRIYNEMEENISDGIKYKNKMIDKFKKKRK
jgi:hypothetical protein